MASKTRSDGDGSLYYDKTKDRWVGSLVVTWRDGKPVRRKVQATSRAKAAQRLREMQEKLTRGDLPIGRAPTVAEWMDVWLHRIAVRTLRASTLTGYESKTEQYIVPLLGRHRLDKLRPEQVEQAWDELAGVGNPSKDDPRPLSPATIRQAHAILHRALEVAVQRGYTTRNVCRLIDAPSVRDEDEIEALSRSQASRVLAACREQRNAARWSVALSIGLRQGEALGLTWDDVDLEDGIVHVRRALQRIKGQGLLLTQPKTKKSRRSIALPDELLAELKAHRKEQTEERMAAGSEWAADWNLVFAQKDGKPIDPRADWQRWTDLLAAAGVPHRRLHAARHTAATLLLLQGVDSRVAMAILGHSQLSMTSRYQSVMDEMQRDAAARMGAALWGEAR